MPFFDSVPQSILRWAAAAVSGPTGRVRVHSITGLREGGSPWLLRFEGNTVGLDGRSAAVLRLGYLDDEGQRAGFEIETRVFDLASTYQLPTPRLIAADLDGTETGELAILSTVLEGSSRIRTRPGPDRMRAFGIAAAAIHRVPAGACTALPRRQRPIEPVDFAAYRREHGCNELLTEAEAIVQQMPVPDGEPTLVHGDLWQGNVLWSKSRLTGIVDWDCAGYGESGIDLGSARCDAALIYGLRYADEVLLGWQTAVDREAADLEYWDLVAALSTPPDMIEFVAPIQDHGRTDLGATALARHRDTFLRDALDRLKRA
jgi:aminoglycoside phosphotransferase